MKKILLLIVVICTILLSPLSIKAKSEDPAHVIFVNQVRGNECCGNGSFNALITQADTLISNQVPAYFALRYDVLKNDEYVSYLKSVTQTYPQIIKLAALIEVTPDLAKDADVMYRGKSDAEWYEAQNLFTIGYTIEESKKLIDTYFLKFHNTFEFYPEVSSAWMISTESLNYMQQKYHVRIHQLTKEQYATDSYTLYGGPPHYPYPASEKWLFIPDFERKDAPLIVRQTVTDPLLNYGDIKTVYTSQPNDYMRDRKTFGYFKALIDQAIDQPIQKGFLLLGLENSMPDEYQGEYTRQITYIHTLQTEGKVITPDIQAIENYWKAQKITVYKGIDLVKGNSTNNAYWITTPFYRLRIRQLDKILSITDIRIFNKELDDPYNTSPAKKFGYWIIPYLIDASRSTDKDAVPDSSSTTNITLPTIDKPDGLTITTSRTAPMLSYMHNNQLVKINFGADNLSINNISQKNITYKKASSDKSPIRYAPRGNGFSLLWEFENKPKFQTDLNCSNNDCSMRFMSNPSEFEKMREYEYPFLFPDPAARKLSDKHTKVYAHNPFALAKRNPVRLVILPHDVRNLPILLSNPPKIDVPTEIKIQNKSEDLTDNSIQYIDFVSDSPRSAEITVQLSEGIVKKSTIYFAPDCKKQLAYCAKHPVQTYWYLRSVLDDKIRKYIKKEQQ